MLLCSFCLSVSGLVHIAYEEVSKITEELYKKDLKDPDNHDGVIGHLEPDILECNVK